MSDYQLSLAIGKEGQNARLAARLTGWRVDIKSETQLAEEEAGYGEEWAEGEWVQNDAGEMVWQPAEGGEAVSAAEWSRAAEADGVRSGDGRGRRRRRPTVAAASPAPTATLPSRPRAQPRRRRVDGSRDAESADGAAAIRAVRRRRGDDRIAPAATCVGCRRMAGQDELVRVRRPVREIEMGRNLPGRGAWLCQGSRACLEGRFAKGRLRGRFG